MNFKRNLQAEDWVLIGYVVGIAVWFICERWAELAESEAARTDSHQQVGGFDRVELGEQALERIECGETVTVDRWHGGAVRLQGDVVVDVEEIVEEPTEEDSDE